MDLMTHTLAGLVTEQAIPELGSYSAGAVTLDAVLGRIVSSTAAVAEVANGHGEPHSVAERISDRLSVGFGSTTGTLFLFHEEQLTAVTGVIVGVDASGAQFADERKDLHTWPLNTVVALIAD